MPEDMADLADVRYTADVAGIVVLPHILAEFNQILMIGGEIFTGDKKVFPAGTDKRAVYLEAGNIKNMA